MKIDWPNAILCCAGALTLFLLWYNGILPTDLIITILTTEIR